jgi:N-ethylmaleimide reductase
MSTQKAFTPYNLGKITLQNRIVMAPMTRSRAIGNVSNELIAAYYTQRSGAGLIVTEGVAPSPNGLGYARIPGIFSEAQTKSWKQTTDSVHKNGGKIFIQLMHTGRVSHPLNLPEGARVVAPSAVALSGETWTDQEGMKPFPVAEAVATEELVSLKEEFVLAAKNAIVAGFDGIELHGANGYLLEQFLSPVSNTRTDLYGGSIENRTRFVLEVAEATSLAIGADKVGIRLSPYGVYNDMPHYAEIDATYTYLAEKLQALNIAYVHLVDHSSGGAPEVPVSIKKAIREKFTNTLILSGGYTLERAEQDLASGAADLIAFGKPFISNPDLVARFKSGQPLSEALDASTFFTPGAKGFTDYPVLESVLSNA